MPRTYSPIDKIRAELAWVNETPDSPTNAAAGISGVAMKRDTSRERVQALSQQNSGRFGGSITVCPAENMEGAALRLPVI